MPLQSFQVLAYPYRGVHDALHQALFVGVEIRALGVIWFIESCEWVKAPHAVPPYEPAWLG